MPFTEWCMQNYSEIYVAKTDNGKLKFNRLISEIIPCLIVGFKEVW